MTEREEEEIDDFWMRDIEKIESKHSAEIKAKDDEIAELQCEVDGFVSLSETHQAEIARLEAEIARLRTALEKIGNPDMYFRAEYGETAQWMGSGGKTPAEFARKALGGES